jgi:hypothetical protein
MEHVPRIEPEYRSDHHSHGDPVEQQAGDELAEPARSAVGRHRSKEAHASTLTTTGLDIQYQLPESGPYE